MPDSPDYSKYSLQSVRFSVQDMGEVAVRSGAPINMDRRGSYVWYDDFRHGVGKWQLGATGGTGAISLQCSTPFFAPYYCHLTPPAGNNDNAYIQKIFGNMISGRIGYEAVVSMPYSLQALQIEIDVYDGTFDHSAIIKYTPADNKWVIYTGASSNVLVATRDISFPGNVLWYPVKVVFDTNTGKYVRLLLGQSETPLAAYSYYKSANASSPQIRFRMYAISNGTVSALLQIAQVIITHDEP